MHKRSFAANAIPLLYCHSWPGGILEVIKIIDELTTPSAEGEPTFHVVVPSIPGCGFSDPSNVEKMGMKGVAEVFDLLMQRLGYRFYVAHGIDWYDGLIRPFSVSLPHTYADSSARGFDVCRLLSIHYSSRCLAIHTTTPLPYLRPPSLTHQPWQYLRYLIARLVPRTAVAQRLGYHPDDLRTPPRRKSSARSSWTGLGLRLGLYAKPHTLAYALCDSPVGLLAWTRDSLHKRSSLEGAFSVQDAIDFTMMSWLPGPEMPLRYLAATRTDSGEMQDVRQRWTDTPLGISIFPSARSGSPPVWAACVQPLVWVSRHYGSNIGWPVWERPQQVAQDLKTFFGKVMMKRDARLREACIAHLETVD